MRAPSRVMPDRRESREGWSTELSDLQGSPGWTGRFWLVFTCATRPFGSIGCYHCLIASLYGFIENHFHAQ